MASGAFTRPRKRVTVEESIDAGCGIANPAALSCEPGTVDAAEYDVVDGDTGADAGDDPREEGDKDARWRYSRSLRALSRCLSWPNSFNERQAASSRGSSNPAQSNTWSARLLARQSVEASIRGTSQSNAAGMSHGHFTLSGGVVLEAGLTAKEASRPVLDLRTMPAARNPSSCNAPVTRAVTAMGSNVAYLASRSILVSCC